MKTNLVTPNFFSHLFLCHLKMKLHDHLKKFLRSGFSISNGNRTEWSPIQSVIIRVITKSAGVRFVYHEYDYRLNNIQATISAFWLVKSMSINPKSVQKSEIECKKVKLSAKKWNWVQNGEIKMIDSSYFELRQTKWRTKIKQRLKLFI